MTISNYTAINNEKLFSMKILSDRTSITKNELAYYIRELNIKPDKWNNSWVLAKDEVIELMNYLLIIYRLKKIRLSKMIDKKRFNIE